MFSIRDEQQAELPSAAISGLLSNSEVQPVSIKSKPNKSAKPLISFQDIQFKDLDEMFDPDERLNMMSGNDNKGDLPEADMFNILYFSSPWLHKSSQALKQT